MAQNFLIGDANTKRKPPTCRTTSSGIRPDHRPTPGEADLPTDLKSFTRINVSGRLFLLREDHLARFPDTLLGSRDRERYWRADLNAYYFNRNREFFVSVHQFYQRQGEYTFPHAVHDRHVIAEELKFYRISVKLRADDEDGFEMEEIVTSSPSTREIMYMLLNFPKSSTSANVLAWLDCLLIGLSVIMLVIESEPMYKKYFSSEDEAAHRLAFITNCIIMGYFTTDYVMRLLSHPNRRSFFKLHLPWLDLLSILPFYLELVMMGTKSSDGASQGIEHDHDDKAYTILRICRIFRVTRVFKLVRRCESLLVLVRALSKTRNELVLLAGMVSMSAIVMGSVMYIIENPKMSDSVVHHGESEPLNDNKFTSILDSCWWAIITITTVGYGDMVPHTLLGKVCGSLAVFLALVLIALPATIIVTKFSEEYEKGANKDT